MPRTGDHDGGEPPALFLDPRSAFLTPTPAYNYG